MVQGAVSGLGLRVWGVLRGFRGYLGFPKRRRFSSQLRNLVLTPRRCSQAAQDPADALAARWRISGFYRTLSPKP